MKNISRIQNLPSYDSWFFMNICGVVHQSYFLFLLSVVNTHI